MSRTVAIVGRPNVGKSRLFNRLARRRISIVHDQPGVTRDVVSAQIPGGITLLDTGGIGLEPGQGQRELVKASEKQVDFALGAADLILFVLDGRSGATTHDETIARRLRRSGRKVLPVVNKMDHDAAGGDAAGYLRLGLGLPVMVSAEHGRGETELREAILQHLPQEPEKTDEAAADGTGGGPLKICFAGRPNVGKSSLANRLLQSERLIVSDVPGTTRDAVELDFTYLSKKGEKWAFRLVDTAGIRHGTKVASSVEYFSRVRSLDALAEADIVFLVLDALDGVTRQDQAIGGEALKLARPMVVVVNKWDLVHDAIRSGALTGYTGEAEFRRKFLAALQGELFFTPGSPVVFISAKKGFEIGRLLQVAHDVDSRLDQKLSTGRLNQILIRMAEQNPPPIMGGGRFRVYYATQTGNRPFRIRLFCNQARRLEDSYRRYLEKGIVEEFDLGGCPVHFELVSKEKREASERIAGRRRRDALQKGEAGGDAGGNDLPDLPED